MSSPSGPGYQTTPNSTVLVTGSSGFVGSRLVEMLLERNAAHVICFDIVPPNDTVISRFNAAAKSDSTKLSYFSGPDGDLTSAETVEKAFASKAKIDVVYHIAALVGPFHDRDKYMGVNYQGTIHILDSCKKHKVPRLIFSSSPSTRFTGADVEGQREEELPIPKKWLALYAETKALAEMEVAKANNPPDFMTISVAPHQVYGPHDSLFLPSLLETAGNGRLRIFGKGDNKISVCYVDNYGHGLMCGADALTPESTALGKFYIITDGPEQKFWDMINTAIVAMGFSDLNLKSHLPVWLLYMVAYVANVIGFLIGKKFKLNPFNVRMLTMHRYFSIENARKDLKYEPLFSFEEAWNGTIEWFRVNWLPGFWEKKAAGGGSNAKLEKMD